MHSVIASDSRRASCCAALLQVVAFHRRLSRQAAACADQRSHTTDERRQENAPSPNGRSRVHDHRDGANLARTRARAGSAAIRTRELEEDNALVAFAGIRLVRNSSRPVVFARGLVQK